MYKEFKLYVDNTSCPIEAFHADRNLVNQYFSIDPSLPKQVTSFLYEKIREELEVKGVSDAIKKTTFYKLNEDLIDRYILLNEDLTEYLKVIKVVGDSCRTEGTMFVNIENKEKWCNAIAYAKSFNLVSSTFNFSITNLRREYPEDVDRANSKKYIIKHGAELDQDDEALKIEKSEILFKDLESKIARIGGIKMAIFLFKFLDRIHRYSEKFERFLITRETATLAEQIHPQIPFGYLLNISAKYPYESRKKIADKEIADIIEKAKKACNAVYPVQHYSMWGYIMTSGDVVIEKLNDMVLWDSIFCIPQTRSSNIIEMCAYLFDGFSKEKVQEVFGFSLEQYIEVAAFLFKKETFDHPKTFSKKDIKSGCVGIPSNIMDSILNRMAFDSKANPHYLLPHDIASVDYFFKPLIRIENNYILFCRSWNALALFEVLATGLRDSFSKPEEFDSFIGLQLEAFLGKKLSDYNIIYTSGKYKKDGIEGEADLIIETDKVIILFEIKKKVLTRKAKSGIDTELMVDLSETVIDSSLQSARTEILVRKHGELKLTDSIGKEYTLFHNGRDFEHVSVTQMEFGGLQNKEIMSGFLKTLLRYSFNLTSDEDKRLNKKFAALKLKQEEWVKQYTELTTLSGINQRNPYFNNWFISCNQLLDIISLSASNENFYKNFTTSKHSIHGMFDFYAEFLASTNTNNNPVSSKLADIAKLKNVTYVRGL